MFLSSDLSSDFSVLVCLCLSDLSLSHHKSLRVLINYIRRSLFMSIVVVVVVVVVVGGAAAAAGAGVVVAVVKMFQQATTRPHPGG